MSFVQVARDGSRITSVQLDTVTTDAVDSIVEDRPITWRVVDSHGPGGGNSVLEFTGPENALLDMMVKHYSLDVDEAFELYGIGPAPDSIDTTQALSSSVQLVGTADRVVGISDPAADGWDWIAGYVVMRTAPGEHGGHPATRITLADSDGGREVGRLVLRNDALRGSALEWTRQFETDKARDAFVARLTAGDRKPAVCGGDGWSKREVRLLQPGDVILLEGDPDDDAVNDCLVPVERIELFAEGGAVNVRVHFNPDHATGFYPASYLEYRDPLYTEWTRPRG